MCWILLHSFSFRQRTVWVVGWSVFRQHVQCQQVHQGWQANNKYQVWSTSIVLVLGELDKINIMDLKAENDPHVYNSDNMSIGHVVVIGNCLCPVSSTS